MFSSEWFMSVCVKVMSLVPFLPTDQFIKMEDRWWMRQMMNVSDLTSCISARPKIRVPRALRARYVKQVGEQINVVFPFLVSQHIHTPSVNIQINCLTLPCIFSPLVSVSPTLQGKPKPVVSWLKDGQPLDTKRVNIRNSASDSILFIRSTQREDSGVYEMTVKVDSFEDKANLILQIVGESHMFMFTLKQEHTRPCPCMGHVNVDSFQTSLLNLLSCGLVGHETCDSLWETFKALDNIYHTSNADAVWPQSVWPCRQLLFNVYRLYHANMWSTFDLTWLGADTIYA